jgi:hypothetical protein
MKQSEVIDKLSPLVARSDIPEDARTVIQSTLANSPLNTDVFIYRAVVMILGACVLATVFGGIVLTYLGKGDEKMALPAAIVAIGSAAVGALAGLLAPSPKE